MTMLKRKFLSGLDSCVHLPCTGLKRLEAFNGVVLVGAPASVVLKSAA